LPQLLFAAKNQYRHLRAFDAENVADLVVVELVVKGENQGYSILFR
jgi:hypothetical protein